MTTNFGQFLRAVENVEFGQSLGLVLDVGIRRRMLTDREFAMRWFEDWSRKGQPPVSTYVEPPIERQVPAAWYPAPDDSGRAQWWDGQSWTQSFAQPLTVVTQPGEPLQRLAFHAQRPAKRSGHPGVVSIVVGFGICLLGIIISIASYSSASPGGTYIVAWGAVVFGAWQGIRGVIRLLRD